MFAQLIAALLGDDADLSEAARQLRRRGDVLRQRFDAFRQRRIFRLHADIGPAHRCRGIDRRVEIVAEHGADRFFIALGDGDAVDDRRPQILGLAVEDLADGLGFGLEPLHLLLGVDQRCPRAVQRLPRGDLCSFRFLHRAFLLGQQLLGDLDRFGEFGEVAGAGGLGGEPVDLALDVLDLGVEPRQPVAMGADALLELVAPCGEFGELGGEFGEQLLGFAQRGIGFGDALVDAAALLDPLQDLLAQLDVFGVEPFQRGVGVDRLLLLARDVGGELRQPPLQFDHALLGAGFFAVELFAGIDQSLQAGSGAGFSLAQARQSGSAIGLDAGGFGLHAGAFGELPHAEIVHLGGRADLGLRVAPAQVIQHRLGLADLGGDLAEPDRLARLLLQAVDLG